VAELARDASVIVSAAEAALNFWADWVISSPG
jgi:hypothetical protein